MRKTRIIPFLILFTIVLGSCEITDDGNYVAPITNYEKISGTWNLKTIKQIDEIAKVNLTKPNEFVLTTEFGFSSFQIKLNVDDSINFNPTTFEVLGNSPELFLKTGFWKLDNPFVNTDGSPTHIMLYSDEAKSQLVDQLILAKIPAKDKNLEFKLTRTFENTPFVTYDYLLTPLVK
jgi:hypothetical protein